MYFVCEIKRHINIYSNRSMDPGHISNPIINALNDLFRMYTDNASIKRYNLCRHTYIAGNKIPLIIEQ